MSPESVTRFLFHFILLCVICVCFSTNIPRPLCSVKSVNGGQRIPSCKFLYARTDCEWELSQLEQEQQNEERKHSVPYPTLSSPSPSQKIHIREKRLDYLNSLVDLNFTLQNEGLMVLRVSGLVSGTSNRYQNRQGNRRSRSRGKRAAESSSYVSRDTRADTTSRETSSTNERQSSFGGKNEGESSFGGKNEEEGSFGGKNEGESSFGGKNKGQKDFGGKNEEEDSFGGKNEEEISFSSRNGPISTNSEPISALKYELPISFSNALISVSSSRDALTNSRRNAYRSSLSRATIGSRNTPRSSLSRNAHGSSLNSGEALRNIRRCVLVVVKDGNVGDVVEVNGLPLPHGKYNLTKFVPHSNQNEGKNWNLRSPSAMSLSANDSSTLLSLSSSSSSSKPIILTSSLNSSSPSSSSSSSSSPVHGSAMASSHTSTFSAFSTVAHHSISLPSKKSGQRTNKWDRLQRRSRREKDEIASLVLGDDPIEEEEEANGGCESCYEQNVDYNKDTAVITYTFELNDTCPARCANVTVKLYNHPGILNKTRCENENKNFRIMDMIPKGQEKNISKGPLMYFNIDKGCYMFDLEPQVWRHPERSRLFWLQPNINVTDMRLWNISIYLELNRETRSVTVHWNEMPKYNFTEYILQLWQRPTFLNCIGNELYNDITVIPNGHLLKVTGKSYTFENMSSGWYCARLTPMDDRCPQDGCPPRSSKAKQLEDPLTPCNGTDCEDPWPTGAVAGFAVASALTVVFTGMVAACCVLRCYPSLTNANKTIYTPVPVKTKCDGWRVMPSVLVVWTPQGTNGHKFGQVVTAFKDLLHSYAHCQVLDYLDMLTLPDDQRHHLMSYPVAWLDSVLHRRDIKIIIIASAGAKQRQRESFLPVNSSQNHQRSSDTSLPPLDPLLFPYLLRKLQDQPNLAADYSRVFHVRFSEVSTADTELEGIVSWTRYCLPEHLSTLARSLHGDRDDSMIPAPTTEQLNDLTNALKSHPDYRPHIYPSSQHHTQDILTSTQLNGTHNGTHNGIGNHNHIPNGNSHSTQNGKTSFV